MRANQPLLLAALLTAITPDLVQACSLSPFPMTRDPSGVYFIGTALGDTVAVGQGSVKLGEGSGHYGNGTARPFYGQVVAVEQIGEPWRNSLPNQVSRMVLVPWDYDAACHPVPWTLSTRWVSPGTRGVYHAALRSKEYWVDGIPTLDVFAPEFAPYPSGPGYRWEREQARREDSLTFHELDAEHYLDLVGRLPSAAGLSKDAVGAATPVREWVAEHPDLAGAWPATRLAWFTRYLVGVKRREEYRSPIAGTYLVEVIARGGLASHFYLRTESGYQGSPFTVTRPDGVVIEAGVEILAYHSRAVEPLPIEYEGPFVLPTGYHTLALDAQIRTPDSTVYRGTLQGLVMATRLEPDSAVKTRWRMLQARADTLLPNAWMVMPGRWLIRNGLPITYEWVLRDSSGVLFTVRARQVSGIFFSG